MITQTILWTALPDRIENDVLHLSVFVAPRLRTDEHLPRPTLAQFPDFVAWPEKIRAMRFIVEIENGPPSLEAARVSADPDPDLWADLFKDTTFVRPYEFNDYRHRIIRSFPVRGVVGYLKNVYRDLAESAPTDLPNFQLDPQGNPRNQALHDLIDALGGVTNRRPESLQQLDEYLQQAKALDPNSDALFGMSSRAELNFVQTNRFFDRSESEPPHYDRPDANLVPPPPEVPDIDFHQMLATLGDYPVLLRRLGLVIDLRMPLANVPSSTLRVRPQWVDPPSPFNTDETPGTRYIIAGGRFMAAPLPNSDIGNRMLKLQSVSDSYANDETPFDLVQVDATGAALKTVNMAGSLQRLRNAKGSSRVTYTTGEEAGLPSLQSAGIALTRYGRAFALTQRFDELATRNVALANGQPVTFWAEHLVRGYRVDVLDPRSGKWRSLCERRGMYRIVDDAGNPLKVLQDDAGNAYIEDEGYIKGASTTSRDAANSDLYLHETVVRWDGWSVVAPRPGQTIVPEPYTEVEDGTTVPRQNEVVRHQPSQAATEFKLETHFAVKPGTLPRLRYGAAYRMRVRMVDLAGNSETLDGADETLASEEIIYSRWEPVLPPTLVQRDIVTEGESLEHMVIRSNYNQSAADYVKSEEVQDTPTGTLYKATNERHVAAPKTSQLMAETHGMFDEAIGSGKEHAAAYNVALREAGTFFDMNIIDITTGQPTIPADGIELITPPAAPPPHATLPLTPGQQLSPGQYVIHNTDNLRLPYLPDPFARGVAFRDLPGVEAPGMIDNAEMVIIPGATPEQTIKTLKVPFDGAWPEARPFRIRLAERPGMIPADACSEAFSDDGTPRWDPETGELTVYLGKAETARVKYSSLLGSDAAGNKDLYTLGMWRWLDGSPRLAELEQYADAGALWMVTPFRELVLVHAVQQPLCKPQIDQLSASKLQIGDTFAALRGEFHLSAKSTGRLDLLATWEEPVDELFDPAWKLLPGQAHVLDFRIEPSYPDHLLIPVQNPEAPNQNLLETFRHEFGDTRYRRVTYYLRGTTRFREYFPPEITQNPANITRDGDLFTIDVLSSARPAAPRLLYVVPAWGWQQQAAPEEAEQWTTFERKRLGGALRVYLERPWFSSGDGELLGVVLAPVADPAGVPEALKPYVTHIGQDPIWNSNKPKMLLSPSDFANAVTSESGLRLDEVPGSAVSVVGFQPEYDPERKLWYCDLQFAPSVLNTYFPFVRLALVRFQPNSMNNDVKLSRVVVADFAQFVPDRMLTLTFRNERDFRVTVSGSGPLGRPFGAGMANYNRVELTIEAHDGAIPGDLGWTLTASSTGQPNPRSVFPTVSNWVMTWDTALQLPVARGALPLRLVVKEYERFVADPPAQLDERLVYADVVTL